MQTPLIKFEILGFKLSTDYDKLWDLIQNNHRIPAWLLYTDEYEEPIFDIVEVKKPSLSDRYMIGTRGIGYEGFKNTKDDFIRVCQKNHLHFIHPIPSTPDALNFVKECTEEFVKSMQNVENTDIKNNNSKNV